MTLANTPQGSDYALLKERVGEHYAHELVEESAIDPAVALERGYENLRHPTNPWDLYEMGYPEKWFRPYLRDYNLKYLCTDYLPDWYWDNLIGFPALGIPKRSPDQDRIVHEIKPSSHAFNDNRKYIFPPKSEEGMILDVHPRGFEHLQDTSVPAWITEGAKKGDALTSQGVFAISLSGVWGFLQKKFYDGEFLACFDYIAWEGRKVIIAFDADAKANQSIQDALARLVEGLEERGAEVLVIYTPPVNGDNEAGVDDYLAAGGDLHALLRQAAPYTRLDVSHEEPPLVPTPALRAWTIA